MASMMTVGKLKAFLADHAFDDDAPIVLRAILNGRARWVQPVMTVDRAGAEDSRPAADLEALGALMLSVDMTMLNEGVQPG